MDCPAVCALCFVNGMTFIEDILDREDIFHNGGPTVNEKVTHGPAIVQMLAPKPAKASQDYAKNILIPNIPRNFGVCKKK